MNPQTSRMNDVALRGDSGSGGIILLDAALPCKHSGVCDMALPIVHTHTFTRSRTCQTFTPIAHWNKCSRLSWDFSNRNVFMSLKNEILQDK